MMPWLPRPRQDPVCGAILDEKTATFKIEYAERTFYFCSVKHMEMFMSNPSLYVKKQV
jgi:YHS domain-containing protein